MTVQKPFPTARPFDAHALAAQFQGAGRAQIPDFLAQADAERLHLYLKEYPDWVQVLNAGERVVELPRPLRADLPAEKLADLDTAVYAGARHGFQYRYESIRTDDSLLQSQGTVAADDLLHKFAQWMNQPQQLALWRHLTGVDSVNFVDAQATAYSPGDFLTGHDDAVVGKGRHAAFVFSLNPIWRLEWGGLLLFHPPEDGGELAGFVPSFNTLNLFAVPSMHSVSLVSRAAANRRYSITGWIRTI